MYLLFDLSLQRFCKRPCISRFGADMMADCSVTIREATVRFGRAEQRRARVSSMISRYVHRSSGNTFFVSYRSVLTDLSPHCRATSRCLWPNDSCTADRETLVHGFCHVYLYDWALTFSFQRSGLSSKDIIKGVRRVLVGLHISYDEF